MINFLYEKADGWIEKIERTRPFVFFRQYVESIPTSINSIKADLNRIFTTVFSQENGLDTPVNQAPFNQREVSFVARAKRFYSTHKFLINSAVVVTISVAGFYFFKEAFQKEGEIYNQENWNSNSVRFIPKNTFIYESPECTKSPFLEKCLTKSFLTNGDTRLVQVSSFQEVPMCQLDILDKISLEKFHAKIYLNQPCYNIQEIVYSALKNVVSIALSRKSLENIVCESMTKGVLSGVNCFLASS